MLKPMRKQLCGLVATVVATVGLNVGALLAQDAGVIGQSYIPTIWVDPDGCEHWVMDDGAEGFMG